MLTGPRVVSVEVGSSDWSSDFIAHLQAESLGIRGIRLHGQNQQQETLSYSNLNQIAITFDGPVNVSADHLEAFGLNGHAFSSTGFAYDTGNYVAIWSFSQHFGNDRVRIDVDGDGMYPITGENLVPLDGDWIDFGQSFPSGDGATGGDFEFTFHVLPGNADDSDNQLNLFDFRLIKDNFGFSGFGHPADFDASGRVGLEDFRVLKDSFGATLAEGNHFEVHLQEDSQFSRSATIPIETGQQNGSRIISLDIDAVFDTSDTTSSSEDQLLISIVDPYTGNTILGNELHSTPLFVLKGNDTQYDPSLATYQSGLLEIDVSSLSPMMDAAIRVQLVNFDYDTGGQATVRLLRNTVHPDNEPPGFLPLPVYPMDPGPAIDTSSLQGIADVEILLRHVCFDETTEVLDATLAILNQGLPIGRQNVIVINGLPLGATVANASGHTPEGKPYLNLTEAVQRGGLPAGAESEMVALRILNPGNQSLPLTFQVLTGAPNQPPQLDPFSPVTMLPGEVREVPLLASDVDGDPVSFAFAMPTGLPGATITANGKLRLAPTPQHIGTHSIDIVASDGVLDAMHTLMVTVNADPLTTTRISGIIQNTAQQPLVDVPIELGSTQVLTQSDGSFVLEFPGTLPDDTLKIRGEAISGLEVYPFIAEKLPLLLGRDAIEGVNNVVTRPIYLPPLDVANGTPIDPAQNISVTTPNLPGIEVIVAAGSLEDQSGSPFTGMLSITEVPPELTPAALPANLVPDLVVTIQPGEMVFTQPAPLNFPNRLAYPPGTQFDLWSINPITGDFDDVGDAIVSPDGQSVVTTSGGIRNSSWHFVAQQNLGVVDRTGNLPAKPEQCLNGTSHVGAASGTLIESHTTPAYYSLGASRSLTLTYNSKNVVNNHAFNFETGLPAWFPGAGNNAYLGATLTITGNGAVYELPAVNTPAALNINNLHVWRAPDVTVNNRVSAGLLYDTRALPDGVYNYSLSVGTFNTSNGFVNGTLTPLNGSFIKRSGSQSLIGRGWGIAGIQRLLLGAANVPGTYADAVILLDGDGTEHPFRPQADGSYLSPPGDFSVLRRLGDGTFQRRMTDGTIYQFDGNHRLASMTDRNGNTSSYAYGAAGELISITDPVGLVTTLSYSANGIDAITLPDGRVIDIFVDGAGNLKQITDPDGSTRQFHYDTSHRMTGETTPRGFTETIQWDAFGRVSSVIRKDGSTYRYTPSQLRGMLNPLTTSAVIVPRAFVDTGRSTTVMPGGNVVNMELDRSGLPTRISDGLGTRASFERNAFQQVTTATDWRGATTRFTYDGLGNVTTIMEEVTVQKAIFDASLSIPADGLAFAAREHTPAVTSPSAEVIADLDNDGNPDVIVAGTVVQGGNPVAALSLSRGDSAGGLFPAALIPLAAGSNIATVSQIFAHDVNRDGNIDLVLLTQDFGGASARILHGDGQGGLTQVTVVALGTLPNAARIADINADNRLDLIGVHYSQDQLSVRLGSAGGGFGAPTFYATGDGPRDLAIEDMTRDGWLDVILTNQLEDTVSIWENNRAGGLTERPRIPTDDGPTYLAVADVNGDTFSDIVTTHTGGFQLLINGRDGSFTSPTPQIPLPGTPQDIAIFDASGDGTADLFLPLNIGQDDASVFYRNDGAGAFSLAQTVPGEFINVAVADMNGDGYRDLVSQGNQIQVLLQTRNGELGLPSTLSVGTDPTDSLTVDLNNDGFPDLVVVNSDDNTVSLMLGDGNGQFLGPTTVPVGQAPFAVAAGDLNQDGFADLVVTNAFDSSLSLLYGDGTGAVANTVTLDVTGTFELVAMNVAIGDLNGDGWNDIVTSSWRDSNLSIFYADGNGGFLPRTTIAWPHPDGIVLSDFNRDGLLDIGAAVQPSGFVTRFNDVNGGFVNPQTYNTGDPGSRSTSAALADFNGDGNVDVVVVSEFRPGPYVLLGTPTGIFQNPVPLGGDPDATASYDVHVADMNGDGNADFVSANADTGRISIYPGNGDGTFGPRVSFFAGDYPVSVSSGDFDSDGRPDLASVLRRENSVALLTSLPSPETHLLTQAFEYEPNFSQLTRYTDEEGRTYSYEVDPANGNLIRVSGPLGYSMSFTYEPNGLLDTETDPLGRVTDYEYDAFGRLTSVTFATGTAEEGTVSYTYDARGNVETFTDEIGNVTEYLYDAMNQLALERDAIGFETSYDYDHAGNVLSVTDALSRTTSFIYDAMDRLLSVTDPIGNRTDYSYDLAGNLLLVSDPLGNTTRHGYDIAQRRVRTTDPDGGIVDFRYDRSDNLTAVLDQSRNLTSFFYDERERMIREIDPLSKSTFYPGLFTN
jgi:YD repeat-containing protein